MCQSVKGSVRDKSSGSSVLDRREGGKADGILFLLLFSSVNGEQRLWSGGEIYSEWNIFGYSMKLEAP